MRTAAGRVGLCAVACAFAIPLLLADASPSHLTSAVTASTPIPTQTGSTSTSSTSPATTQPAESLVYNFASPPAAGEAPPLPAADPCAAVEPAGTQAQRKCWEKQLASITRRFSPASALSALHEWRESFLGLQTSCHEYTHAVGRAAYDLYRNPFQALKFDDRTCQYGYRHGVFESFASAEGSAAVREAAKTICDIQSNTLNAEQLLLETGECLHAVGHAAAIAESGNILAAVGICDVYEPGLEREGCSGGVFMEFGNSFVLAKMNDGVADATHGPSLSRIDDETADRLCQLVGESYLSECYRRIANFWGPLDPQGIPDMLQRCQAEAGAHVGKCMSSVGEWAFRMSSSSPTAQERVEKVAHACSAAPSGELRGWCLYGAARPLRANDLWERVQPSEWAELCDLADDASKPTCELAETDAEKSVANIPDEEARSLTSGQP